MNPTQLLGLASFLGAATVCALAAFLSSDLRRLWKLITLAYALLFVEVLIDGRFRFSDYVTGHLLSENFYQERHGVQIFLMAGVALFTVAIFLSLLVMTRRITITAKLSLLGCVLAIAVFLVELVSLHAIDAVLYTHVYQVLVVGWIWFGCALLSSLGAIASLRNAMRQKD